MAAMALFLLLSLDSLSPMQLGSQLELELGSQQGLARQLGYTTAQDCAYCLARIIAYTTYVSCQQFRQQRG